MTGRLGKKQKMYSKKKEREGEREREREREEERNSVADSGAI